MNLDAYQDRAARKYKMDVRIPILYFTQLIGLALGIEPKKLGIGREIISASEVLKPYL
jgi:heterodisulfide reductase subunit B